MVDARPATEAGDDRAPGAGRDLIRLGSRLSRAFAAVDAEGLEALMPKALRWLGEHAGVDIAYAAVFVGELVTDVWEWTSSGSPGAPPQVGSAVDQFADVLEILRQGVTIPVEDLTTLELSAGGRALLEPVDARAILLVPVLNEGELVGVIGYLTVGRTHEWLRADVDALKVFANLMIGAVHRTRLRATMALADQRAARIAAFVPDALLFCDEAGCVTWASPSTAAVLGWTPGAIEGRLIDTLADVADAARLRELLAGADADASAEPVRIAGSDGDIRWFDVSASRIDARGTHLPAEVLLSLRDVTARQREVRQLADVAVTDPLTGVLNRRGLRQAIDALEEADLPAGAAFLDLDGFKAVNDTFGHDVGDVVLAEIGRRLGILAAELGASAARLGGDEFVLLLTRVSDGGLDELGETVARRIGGAVAAGAAVIGVSCSVGTASVRTLDQRPYLVTEADAAMYRAKRGRSSG